MCYILKETHIVADEMVRQMHYHTGTHISEGQHRLHKLFSDSTHVPWRVCTTYTHTVNTNAHMIQF